MKYRKTIFITFFLILVAFSAGHFLNSDDITVSYKEHYVVTDTASVHKIILSRGNDTIILTRSINNWHLSNGLKVRPYAMFMFFKTIKNLRMKSPVPESKIKGVIDSINSNSTAVGIYTQNKLICKYKVGSVSVGKTGTYMLAADEEKPLIMHIPGFSADLNSFFVVDQRAWKDKTIFHFLPNQIKKIEVKTNIPEPDSFMIENVEGKFTIHSNQLGEESEKSIQRYVSYFQNIKYLGISNIDKFTIKDLCEDAPFYTAKITDIEGVTTVLNTYRKRVAKTKNDTLLTDEIWDFNLLYGKMNNSDDLLEIKYIDLDPIIKPASYFYKATQEKK